MTVAHAQGTAPVIDIVYPKPDEEVGTVEQSFVIGNIFPATGTLTLNGDTVAYTSRGQFLHSVPVQPGRFTIRAEVLFGTATAAAAERVAVVGWPEPRAPKNRLALYPVAPARELVLKPGNWLRVAARATPGGAMTFTLPGSETRYKMAENAEPLHSVYWDDTLVATDRDGGFYEGAVQVRRALSGKVRFHFTHPRHGAMSAAAPGTLSVRDGWRAVRVNRERAVARWAPNGGAAHMFVRGTVLRAAGRAGEWVRARLAPEEDLWLRERDLEFLPDGAPPPAGRLEMIRVRGSRDAAAVDFTVDPGVPLTVDEDGSTVRVTLYETTPNVAFTVYDPAETYVREITHRGLPGGKTEVALRLATEDPLWGWGVARSSAGYTLTLRKPPVLRDAERPLEGLNVVLDAGHGADHPGSVGPLRTLEADSTFDLASRVRDRLLREGALITLTRTQPEDAPSLDDRVRLAREAGGDLFLSLHFNAMPAAVDKDATPRGFQVYYYGRHSLELARMLTEAYADRLELPNEGFRRRDYRVLRLTEMPAVLLESAYMMYPDQELLILDPGFQDKVADTIVAGLRAYLWKVLR